MQTVRLIYVGRAITTQKKVGMIWRPISTDVPLPIKEQYAPDSTHNDIITGGAFLTRLLGLRVGAIYDFEQPEPDTFRAVSDKPVGYYEYEPDLVMWRAHDVTKMADYNAAKALAKEGAYDALEASLAPVKRAYLTLPAPQRAQMLARIVRYLETR